MYPHERSLVKKHADKPFVILGVNSDRDRTALKKNIINEELPWRSFWDGGTVHGPIATAWKVNAWPTIFVVDAKGVIRYKRRLPRARPWNRNSTRKPNSSG
jgi:hypothetical protein